jgi:hypothetical protein
MNKRQIARRAHDDTHKALMNAYRVARGGSKLKALAKLKSYMTSRLAGGK